MYRFLGDVYSLLQNILVGAAKAMSFLGLYGGDTGGFRQMSSDKDYAGDIDKGLGSSADRVADLVKTFSAIGNQRPAEGHPAFFPT